MYEIIEEIITLIAVLAVDLFILTFSIKLHSKIVRKQKFNFANIIDLFSMKIPRDI